jgi:hypothetical protein
MQGFSWMLGNHGSLCGPQHTHERTRNTDHEYALHD